MRRGDSMAKIRLKLNTATEVRRTLVRISNMVVNGEIDSKRANTIILACNAVLSAIRTDDQQEKIEYLEMLFKEMEKGNKGGK